MKKGKGKVIIALAGILLCAVGCIAYFITKEDSATNYVSLPKDVYHLKFVNDCQINSGEDAINDYINQRLYELNDIANPKTWENIDDDYIKDKFGMSLDEFRKECKEKIEEKAENDKYVTNSEYIFSYIMKNSEFNDIPNEIIDERITEQVNAIKRLAVDDEVSYEDYVKNTLRVSSTEKYEATVKANMKTLIKQEYAMKAVVEHYNIKDDYDNYVKENSNEEDADSDLYLYLENGGTEQTRINYYKNLAMPRLIKDADITYTQEKK